MEPYLRLETELAIWIGAESQQMVVCSSGTAALQLALTALRLPPRSRVLVPECGFVACGRSVRAAGLEPVFVDCGDDLLIDLHLVVEASWDMERITAILPVHIHGRRCEMDELLFRANRKGWKVVEDMAQLHGVAPDPRSDAACWSFNRTKVVHGEEGGACWFRDKERAKDARVLRNQGHYDDDLAWSHHPGGSNWRMANALAIPILNSLRMAGERMLTLRQSERQLDELCPKEWRMPERQSPWVYDLRVPDGMSVEVVQALRQAGIAARCCFRPLGDLPEFMSCTRIGGAKRARAAFHSVIALPLPMTGEQAERAMAVIKSNVDYLANH